MPADLENQVVFRHMLRRLLFGCGAYRSRCSARRRQAECPALLRVSCHRDQAKEKPYENATCANGRVAQVNIPSDFAPAICRGRFSVRLSGGAVQVSRFCPICSQRCFITCAIARPRDLPSWVGRPGPGLPRPLCTASPANTRGEPPHAHYEAARILLRPPIPGTSR